MSPSLLYRAAWLGIYGRYCKYEHGSIADALFVFLDGKPDPKSIAVLDAQYPARPWVCLTAAWEDFVRTQYPDAAVYQRYAMKPLCRFRIPEAITLPDGYRLSLMDEASFSRHPFGHGKNYSSFGDFHSEGSGAVVYRNGEIIASASSFLSLDSEVEMDVFTREEYRGMGLAGACIAMMLQNCMDRRITVHWDAQNEVSRHLAEKFGYETETEYSVYWARKEKPSP